MGKKLKPEAPQAEAAKGPADAAAAVMRPVKRPRRRQPPQPTHLPILPVRDVVIFPYMIIPLFVGRSSSINAVDHAIAGDKHIFLSAQKDYHEEEPVPNGVYSIGTIGLIMRMHKLPDGRVKILVQGVGKGKIKRFSEEKSIHYVDIERMEEPAVDQPTLEDEAQMRTVKEIVGKIVGLGKPFSQDAMMVIEEEVHPGRLADILATNLGLKIPAAQEVLEVNDPAERLRKVHEHLMKEYELLQMQLKIQNQAKEEMTKTQREYYLREQLRAIKNELGSLEGKGDEFDDLRKKISGAKLTKEAREEAQKQLKKLESMHSDSAEASVVRSYLEWITELPWKKSTKDNIDIAVAQKILDEDHFDLEKIKDRILDYLSVCKLRQSIKGPILCLAGPPGVGKTSLGRSIAKAMGRKFVRISLGGLKDEAEIRGHRRTYVGALPGRIIQGIKQAGSNNPVFMLDEVDKIGQDFRGDPSSALLEVLDPEQNTSFADHYLNIPFDLSKVMFILTANMTDPVPPALRDRMEILTIPGYSEEEKLAISKKYLVPKQETENGLKPGTVELTDKAIIACVRHYTREAGLRNLERELSTVLRKVARRIAEDKAYPKKILDSQVSKFLGPPKFLPESELFKSGVGIATGLAWTQYGGEVLHVEVSAANGKGTLTLTGHLGDVMKESAMAAVSYLKAHASALFIPPKYFEEHEIHVHVPAGATPKDGPSAGITMATALLSSISNIPIRGDIAMTGEISLQGRVLPVGGVKEKVLAALRANIFTIIIPKQNFHDLEELPPHLRKKLHFVLVDTVERVFEEALAAPLGPPLMPTSGATVSSVVATA